MAPVIMMMILPVLVLFLRDPKNKRREQIKKREREREKRGNLVPQGFLDFLMKTFFEISCEKEKGKQERKEKKAPKKAPKIFFSYLSFYCFILLFYFI